MTTVSSLGERALIQRITARLSMPPWVVIGPGDDAAVIATAARTHDVITTDALVDGVHLDRRFVPADAIGHRALAVNLSDLAAMGAEPRAALLSLVLPDAFEVPEFDGIVDGFLALAAVHHVTVVGGNITRTDGPLVISVTAIGAVGRRRALRRAGARPGDEVYVTGTLGDAAVGLQMLRDGERVSAIAERYLRPEPRVRAGLMLGRNRAATSCMDLSDGLADGVRQIAEASGVGIELDGGSLPISDAAHAWHKSRGADAVDTALRAGDDYELLFTVRPAHRGRLRHVRQRLGELAVTRIGVVTRSCELVVQEGGTTRQIPSGFEHFR